MIIAPSLLNSDICQIGETLKTIKEAGAAYLHIDVMDGHFVPNMSFGPGAVADIRKKTDLVLDCHLMIEQPEKLIAEFAAAGADIITVHTEATKHVYRVLQMIRATGCKSGVALNPGTAIEAVLPVLELVDQVLVMTVNPGVGGQSFIPSTTEKIKKLKQLREQGGYTFDIQVDGSISKTTIKDCLRAGANVFVSGGYLFGQGDVRENIQSLWKEGEEYGG